MNGGPHEFFAHRTSIEKMLFTINSRKVVKELPFRPFGLISRDTYLGTVGEF